MVGSRAGRAMHGQQRLANHGQQCPANPHGEPCTGRSETQHPYMPEIGCCFRCAKRQKVMRESARLSTEGEPLVSDKCVETKFSLADFQHPVGKVGGLERETLCALCTLPANGDEMLECRGSRDGTPCKLVWHKSCHEMWCSRTLSGGAAAPPSGDVLQCCTGWAARALLPGFEKDRFCQPYQRYRKELRKEDSDARDTFDPLVCPTSPAPPVDTPPAYVRLCSTGAPLN